MSTHEQELAEDLKRAMEARVVGASDAPPFDAPPFDAPPFDAPPFDAPPFDAPPFDAPPFDAPPFDAPPFDAPPFDAPPFGAPPLDAASIGSGVRAVEIDPYLLYDDPAEQNTTDADKRAKARRIVLKKLRNDHNNGIFDLIQRDVEQEDIRHIQQEAAAIRKAAASKSKRNFVIPAKKPVRGVVGPGVPTVSAGAPAVASLPVPDPADAIRTVVAHRIRRWMKKQPLNERTEGQAEKEYERKERKERKESEEFLQWYVITLNEDGTLKDVGKESDLTIAASSLEDLHSLFSRNERELQGTFRCVMDEISRLGGNKIKQSNDEAKGQEDEEEVIAGEIQEFRKKIAGLELLLGDTKNRFRSPMKTKFRLRRQEYEGEIEKNCNKLDILLDSKTQLETMIARESFRLYVVTIQIEEAKRALKLLDNNKDLKGLTASKPLRQGGGARAVAKPENKGENDTKDKFESAEAYEIYGKAEHYYFDENGQPDSIPVTLLKDHFGNVGMSDRELSQLLSAFIKLKRKLVDPIRQKWKSLSSKEVRQEINSVIGFDIVTGVENRKKVVEEEKKKAEEEKRKAEEEARKAEEEKKKAERKMRVEAGETGLQAQGASVGLGNFELIRPVQHQSQEIITRLRRERENALAAQKRAEEEREQARLKTESALVAQKRAEEEKARAEEGRARAEEQARLKTESALAAQKHAEEEKAHAEKRRAHAEEEKNQAAKERDQALKVAAAAEVAKVAEAAKTAELVKKFSQSGAGAGAAVGSNVPRRRGGGY